MPFPTASALGAACEGTGLLVNVGISKNVEEVEWKRVSGLAPAIVAAVPMLPPAHVPRGALGTPGLLVTGWLDRVAVTTGDMVSHLCTGSVPGEDPITFARNNKPIVPDVVAVYEAGAFIIHVDTYTVTAYWRPSRLWGRRIRCHISSYYVHLWRWHHPTSGINRSPSTRWRLHKAEAKRWGLYRGISVGTAYSMGR